MEEKRCPYRQRSQSSMSPLHKAGSNAPMTRCQRLRNSCWPQRARTNKTYPKTALLTLDPGYDKGVGLTLPSLPTILAFGSRPIEPTVTPLLPLSISGWFRKQCVRRQGRQERRSVVRGQSARLYPRSVYNAYPSPSLYLLRSECCCL